MLFRNALLSAAVLVAGIPSAFANDLRIRQYPPHGDMMSGEYGPSSTAGHTPSGTGPAAAGKTLSVTVGGKAGLVYTPEWVNAAPGDIISFDFLSLNHTLTQSTLNSPCVFKDGGVKSGFRSNPQSIPGKEVFTFTVPDSQPQWFYCGQTGHCAKGMVFAVNPGSVEKFNKFKQMAMSGVTNSTVPSATSPTATGTGGPVVSTGAASLDNVPRGALAGLVGAAGIALALF